MTLQQLEYILAVNQFRHFAKAAEYCRVTQPTLSAMIQKLEEELDTRIFDRSQQPVCPTPVGIRTVEGKPGMKEIEIRPRPVGDLTYVRASTQTLYGKVAVDWIRENGVFTLKVTIPVGCTARVFLPDEKEPKIVESGTYSFKK